MSLTRNAGATAAQAANSRWLELLTRAGFIGYGIVHLLFAWLALQIAFGKSGEEGNQNGALRTLGAQPLGTFLLITIAVGLVAMAIWQALEAAFGHRTLRDKDRLFERIASVVRTVVFLWLAWTAVKVFQDASSSSADKQQALSEKLMTSTGGRWLVGLAGLVIAAVGIGMVAYGLKKKFERNLKIGEMSPKTHTLARRLGMAGYAARGAVFAVAGLLVVVAAVNYDPEKARGLDAALRTLRDQPWGQGILTLMGLGIAAFGVYCFLQSRYRKV
ncbi:MULTISPECIES: DUF1206 domain-containing protein [Micromonospora]|uniref:DUF1206 domain-containing protein n=1 Tax=Micromonospora sicca TaxID=2202420 RepID=A0A317DE36_9ACTN|nr:MULTISPECIES: DUF1206 domain-containing protein [unclassified Micromonospora]MBM0229803.1 DUF1206 domain-containing protein [Micromonospora sp. ATA51]PWR13071.1 DUF1206 domain-containing protein [Micromonospora sp. 4G51]